MTSVTPTRLLSGLIPAISERPSNPAETDNRSRHLIAVRTKAGIVCVRNCHTEGRTLVVENIGAVLGLREIDQPLAAVEQHAVVHEPPFSIRVNQPNFMRDLSPEDYEGAMSAALSLRETKWTRDEAEKQETPFEVLLADFREQIGMWRPWTATRLTLLAAGLSVTREELAKLAFTSQGALANAMSSDGERGINDATAGWLFYYEQFVQWVRFGRKPLSMFPEGLLAAHPAGRKGRGRFLDRIGGKTLKAATAAQLTQ